MSPGLGSDTDPAAAAAAASSGDTAAVRAGAEGEPSTLERPEVQAGIAFVGAFLIARILKRIFD